MPNRSKQKGDRFELAVRDAFLEDGLHAEKVPASGARGGSFGGDVHVMSGGDTLTWECKKKKTGFAQLYRWITNNFGVVVAADYSVPLAVVRLTHLTALMRDAEKWRAQSERRESVRTGDGESISRDRHEAPA